MEQYNWIEEGFRFNGKDYVYYRNEIMGIPSLDEKIRRKAIEYIEAIDERDEVWNSLQTTKIHYENMRKKCNDLEAALQEYIGNNVPIQHILHAGRLVRVDKGGATVYDDVIS